MGLSCLGSIDQPDNRALRAAHDLQVPLAYFVGRGPAGTGPSGLSLSLATIRLRDGSR
jgi:hypothetical protein